VLGEVRVGMEGATYRLLPAPPMSNLAVANALRAPYPLAAAFRLI
jgi:hypothetical protein